MNLQKYTSELPFLPFRSIAQYSHRLHRNFFYTDDVREMMCEKFNSWVIDHIFALQEHESGLQMLDIQHWDLKNMPDGSILLSCSDEQGRVVYYEHGHCDVAVVENEAFVLDHSVLSLRN